MTKTLENDDNDTEMAVLIPTAASDESSITAKIRIQTIQCLVSLLIILVTLAVIIISFFWCKICLVVMVVFCLCFCLCIPQLNFPLWVAIFLCIIAGWSFTTGKFRWEWNP